MSHNDESPDWALATRGLRAARQVSEAQEHSETIFATSSFMFRSAAQAAARFAEEEAGYIYSRFSNPTVQGFQERLADMEGGEACVGTASGMSALLATCMALLDGGDHVVSAGDIFGASLSLFNNHLSRFGIATSFVPLTDYAQWEAALRPETRMLFLETPSNPVTAVADIARLAKLAHAHNALLVVDNCFCTPALQRPLELGADLVIHSATKYIDGQGRAIGGAVVGDKERVGNKVRGFLRTAGPTMSPFNAWIFLKGLETLSLRMRAHSDNALGLARWLQKQPGVARVLYPGLEDHAQYHLAAAQQSAPGGIVACEVSGGRDAAWRLIDSTEIISITANLGDARTTITHPASTTHARNSPEQRAAAGIREGLVRISVGLEELADLQRDLKRGLDTV